MEDRSLDEFLGGSSDTDDEADHSNADPDPAGSDTTAEEPTEPDTDSNSADSMSETTDASTDSDSPPASPAESASGDTSRNEASQNQEATDSSKAPAEEATDLNTSPDHLGGEGNQASEFNPSPGTTDSAPVTGTYRWSPSETRCDSCSDPVQQRWLQEGDFVCAQCKEW